MTTLLESYKLPGVAPVRSVFARSNDISVRIGTMIDLSEDGTLMLVDVGGAEYWLPVAPGGYEYGGKVVVEFSGGKPRHVAGAAESGTGNQTVVAHQELIPPSEISPEEKARLEGVEAGLAEAQGRVTAAEGLLDAIGASDGPDGVADAISDYLAVPLDQITIVDNRGADGNVIANLYDAIIVDGLLTASGVITENLIATGAIESRHLNVVPEEGTGGLKLDAYGMDVIGPDTGEATTYVSFRADQANAISFVQDGASTFSVSPAGDLTAQTVAANEEFTYRGEPLSTVLGRLNQGIVSSSFSRLMQQIRMDGSERTILKVNVPARDPALGSRNLMLRFQIVTDRAEAPLGLRIRQTQDGSNVSVSSPLYQEFTTQARNGVITASIPAQVAAGVEWNVLISGWSGVGCVLRPGGITHAYVEDLGSAVPWDDQYPPGAVSGGTETTPTPAATKLVPKTFSPTWTRSFLGNGSFYNYGAGRAYHGQYLASNGILGSAVGFNRTEIASHVASGEIVKVEVFLKNSHASSSAGMAAQWGTHGYTSAPSSYSVPTGGYTDSFKSGEGKWITLPESDWGFWKTGGSNGIRFKPSTTSNMSYGYFDGAATRVRITVRK